MASKESRIKKKRAEPAGAGRQRVIKSEADNARSGAGRRPGIGRKEHPQEASFPASRLEQGARELEGAERSRRGVSDQSQIAHHGLPGGVSKVVLGLACCIRP